ncbi:MAG: hypothetical protein WCD70_06830 [Alphaproteobacteria bacterium]
MYGCCSSGCLVEGNNAALGGFTKAAKLQNARRALEIGIKKPPNNSVEAVFLSLFSLLARIPIIEKIIPENGTQNQGKNTYREINFF